MAEIKECYINFVGEINQYSFTQLIQTINEKIKQGVNRFTLLISSDGGFITPGISGYNFLKGIPAEVITHTYGSADSIAIVLFCAGSKRYSTPNTRFLLHEVGYNLGQGTRLEEKQLNEKLKDLRVDRENMVKIIAENCGRTKEQVEKDLFEVKVLNPNEAKEYGLVHEIKTQLFPEGAEVINILHPVLTR